MKSRTPRISLRLRGVSLKNRLLLIYGGLASAAIVIAVSLYWSQHQLLSSGVEQAEMLAEYELVLKIGVGFLVVYVVLLAAAAKVTITAITQAVQVVTKTLDELDIEKDEAPFSVPKTVWTVPEAVEMFRSVERLLFKLKGYRELSVRRLLREKRRADIIAASVSDGVFLLRGNELYYVNPVGERILGLPADSNWQGLNLENMANGSDDPKDTNRGALAVYVAASRAIPIEFTLEADHQKLHYMLHSYPISDEVIEQVEHSLHGPLEQLLDQWQADTLVIAQDLTMLKESQEAKSHFIASLSHEVRTPVTSLTMATRLLRRTLDQIPGPTQRALIKTCADDVDRLRELIDDLLTASRFDSLAQNLEFKQADIGKLVKKSVQYFRSEAFQRGVEVELKRPSVDNPVLVSMDAAKVSWALSNVLINAIRHTPRGGKVEISVAEVEGHSVEVRVRDSGNGIDRTRQHRIFQKYSPYYDIRVARSGSIGMGLAIAREIIMGHGGKMWVESEPGRGAEFGFQLPIRHDGEKAPIISLSSVAIEARDSMGSKLKGELNSGASARS